MNVSATPPRTTRPGHGQRSLFVEIPDVFYCRRCGRRLYGTQAIQRGFGRHCARLQRREHQAKAKVQQELFSKPKRRTERTPTDGR